MAGVRSAAVRDGAGTGRRASVVGALTASAVLLQVAWPLVAGESLRRLTIASVVVFAAASLSHALASRGVRYAGVLLLVAGGGGLLVEAVGTATGLPFGAYSYGDALGARLLGVPVVVPLAWVMMAHPCAVAGRRLGGTALGWLPAAWLLAAWDVFLDPQMVGEGHWRWAHPVPGLPGVDGIPLTNYAGWLATAALMMLVLVRAAGDPRPLAVDAPAVLLLLWTYASQVLANLAFFGRPAVALWGGALMGAVTVPYAIAVAREARTRR
jgi:putative membrane protein